MIKPKVYDCIRMVNILIDTMEGRCCKLDNASVNAFVKHIELIKNCSAIRESQDGQLKRLTSRSRKWKISRSC